MFDTTFQHKAPIVIVKTPNANHGNALTIGDPQCGSDLSRVTHSPMSATD